MYLQTSINERCTKCEKRITRISSVTKQNRVFGGAWLGFLTHQNNKPNLQFCDDIKHTYGTHTIYWRQMWQSKYMDEFLQCTRKTIAKLNENRHKIAQVWWQNSAMIK
jgi:hypothetical protein